MRGRKPKPKRRSSGEGTVEELPSGNFRAVLPGRGPGRTKTFPKRDEALAWLRKHADAGRVDGTLGEWLDRWMELRSDTAAKSRANDRDAVELHIRPDLGAVRLSALTGEVLVRWLAKMAAAGKTPDQRFRAYGTLRKAVKDHPELPNSIFDKVKPPKVTREKRRALTHGQYAALVAAADGIGRSCPWAGVMVRAGLEMCGRPQEVIALRREDWDPAAGVLKVRRAACPETGAIKVLKTGGSARDVPLSPPAAAALAAWLGSHPSEWVFPGRKAGSRLSYFSFVKGWHRTAKAAGLAGWTPYEGLRHTGATFLVSAGMSLSAVARRMGHADPTLVLRTYSHALPDDQAKLTAVFAGLYPPGGASGSHPREAQSESGPVDAAN